MDYLAHIWVLIAVYATVAVSLDLLVGHTGLLSLSQAAFFGIGAYGSALLTTALGVSFCAGLVSGMVAAMILASFVAYTSLRLSGDYFALVTFAFQVVIGSIMSNWTEVTRGFLGISDIPQPSILGWRIDSSWDFCLLGSMVAGCAYVVVWRISSSPFGRVLHAIREDEVFAESMGKRTVAFKMMAFTISAALAASAGSLYAHYVTYIDPTSFTVTDSILAVSMVVVGGAGSPWGSLVGASVLVTLPEVLRAVGLPNAPAANIRQVLYGVLLVTMVSLRPRGLVGRYGFGR